MKKSYFIIVLIMIISGALSASATVKSFNGKVKVKLTPTSSWSRINVGDSLPANTLVSTGFNSTLVLELNNSTLEVLPLTRMTVSEVAESNDRISTELFLQGGKIKADVKRAKGLTNDFTIKSPVATASVRGTSFEFTGNTLTVLEGVVAFGAPERQLDEGADPETEDQGSLVAVKAGGSSQLVSIDGKPIDPAVMAAAEAAVVVSTKPEVIKDIVLETLSGAGGEGSLPTPGDIQEAIIGGQTTIRIEFNW